MGGQGTENRAHMGSTKALDRAPNDCYLVLLILCLADKRRMSEGLKANDRMPSCDSLLLLCDTKLYSNIIKDH